MGTKKRELSRVQHFIFLFFRNKCHIRKKLQYLRAYIKKPAPRDINFSMAALFISKKSFPFFQHFLPDSTSTCIIIQHSQSMLPCNIICWLWHFADNTFQFYCAARFIEFVRSTQPSFIYYFNTGN